MVTYITTWIIHIHMKKIVRTVIALRNEFRPLEKQLAETEFKRFDRSVVARRYNLEEAGQDLPILTAKREVC
jgi:hypothetical protein